MHVCNMIEIEFLFRFVHFSHPGALRLVPNQQFPNKGRIEIYGNHSQWGTICDDYWTDEAATVACKQLGLGNVGISRGNAYYGSGDGPILLDDVQCGGDEEKLLQCDSSPLGEHNCVHGEDAGVECYEQMPTVAPNKGMKTLRERPACLESCDIISFFEVSIVMQVLNTSIHDEF